MRARASLMAGALVLGIVVSGCGGDDDASPRAEASTNAAPSVSSRPSASATATATESVGPYLPVPAGVTLSDQGAALALGAAATVAWKPRQDTVGVLDVSVDRLEQTTLEKSFTGWKIPEESAGATPYFVRATVTNRGDSDLSGRVVPLYAVDGAQTMIEATSFASVFKPCRDGVFPSAFGAGATAQVCLVYFLPEGKTLTGVTFRPTQEFDPITWTGEIVKVSKTAG